MSGIETERPFRDALVDLTIEANQEGLDPFEAYIRLREKMGHSALYAEDYCSSSITSGGHARDGALAIGEVIRKNTDTAMALCDELFQVGQLHPDTTVEAVVLGKIAWKQSDYMTFWLATMAGLPARGHGVVQAILDFRRDFEIALDRNDQLDMALYDSKSSPELRTPHYFAHATAFAETVRRHSHDPVRRLVRLVDADTSLGAQSEKVFARNLHIGVFGVALAQTGMEPSGQNLTPALVRDTERLVTFGATVFDETRRQQPILVRQPAQ